MIFVNVPVASMRKTYELQGEVISQVIYGEQVKILEKKRDGSKIESDDGYQGWVPTEALIEREPLANPVRLGSLFNHIYRVNDTTPYPPMVTLPFNAQLEVEQEDQRWLRAKLIDGTPCFIQLGDLMRTTYEIIPLAKKFLGLPYTWGGKSSFGFDCSGLIQTLFRVAKGIILPRDAKDQAQDLRLATIAEEEAKAGDLIYFGEKINHVGLIIEGDRLLHATVALNSTQTVIHTLKDINDAFKPRLYKRIQS